MYRVKGGLALTWLLLALAAAPGAAHAGFWTDWWRGDPVLAVINGKAYTESDFRHWWENWKEKDAAVPETPGAFVDWHLQVQEAERMELYRSPSYREKVLTFLKARGLMLLKKEEVDDRVRIREADLWDRYKERYTPRRRLLVLYYQDEAAARAAAGRLASGEVRPEAYAAGEAKDAGAVHASTRWFRPGEIPGAWTEAVAGLEPGGAAGPLAYGKGWAVLCLLDVRGPEQADFHRVEGRVREELRKEQEGRLTADLLRRLRAKYEVRVDEDLALGLAANETRAEVLDRPVVRTNRGSVTARVFLAQIRRDRSFRHRYGFAQGDAAAARRRVLDGILSQTLTTWEALDRHYEERPPFKWVYRFYCQHRLIKELEARLVAPKVRVTEADVRSYYDGHPAEFTEPATVRIIAVQEEGRLVDRIWAELQAGEDFSRLLRHYFPRDIPAKRVPVGHLQPEFRKVVEGLSPGEVSAPFTFNGKATLVQLVARTPARRRPLDEVREEIRERLRAEAFERERAALVRRLREASTVEVREDTWKDIRRAYAAESTTRKG